MIQVVFPVTRVTIATVMTCINVQQELIRRLVGHIVILVDQDMFRMLVPQSVHNVQQELIRILMVRNACHVMVLVSIPMRGQASAAIAIGDTSPVL